MRLRAKDGAVINVIGGVIGDSFSLDAGGEANFSGGIINSLSTGTGSSVNLFGGGMLLNGVPIPGLNAVGDSVAISFGDNDQLSGVFADGTPFAFAETDFKLINSPTVTLHQTALPPIGPAAINLPGDLLPLGIRQGQTLTVGAGGMVGAGSFSNANFVAGAGSTMHVNGGTIGRNFEAVGATVNLTSGEIGSQADLLDGAVLNMSGGTLGNDFQVHTGGVANISGGTLQNSSSFTPALEAFPGAVVNVSGGSIGQGITLRGAEMNISGGSIGARLFAVQDFATLTSAVVNVSGGTFEGSVQASIGSEFNLFGTDFLLNGVEIPSLVIDEPFTVTDRDVTLSGVLADGSPFSFELNSTIGFNVDFFHPTALLTVTLVEPPAFYADFNGDGKVDGSDLTRWQAGYATGTTHMQGDVDGDGDVDGNDFLSWQRNSVADCHRCGRLREPYLNRQG